MKHLTLAEKSLLVGDDIADLLMEYAALLGQIDSADTVEVTAYGADGDPVEVTFLLNAGLGILSETSHATVPEPDNRKAEEYIRQRISLIKSPPNAEPVTEPPLSQEWEF
jgi:hypothetical protein